MRRPLQLQPGISTRMSKLVEFPAKPAAELAIFMQHGNSIFTTVSVVRITKRELETDIFSRISFL